jgi:DNA-binding NtrC family response regulator
MPPRILYISKHSENARVLSRMLDSLPLSFEHAETLEQARTWLAEWRYDVVVTESSLPDGNWQDVLRMLGGNPYETKLIVTDPHADPRLWSEVLNLGGYDLMRQPFCEPEVQRILSNACSRSVPSLAAV